MKISHLWAPWRLEYVRNQKEGFEKCPFCEALKEEPSDENLILTKEKDFFIIMNRFPYNPGHLLILPTEHVGDFAKISPELWSKISLVSKLCLKILKQNSDPHGFNLGLNLGASSGAGIPAHLHWHILPRWTGDTNFMPLIAETKALPTHNKTIYHQLKPLFSHFSKDLADILKQGNKIKK